MFSSRSDEWATPQDLFDKLNEEFQFDLDPCATADNHKCPNFFTKEDDGLTQSWDGWVGDRKIRVFMNPPYGRQIGLWMKKAHDEVKLGHAHVVVCLVPARTDTAWWHDYAMKGEIRFLRGRLKFGGCENSAPFPSAIVIFR